MRTKISIFLTILFLELIPQNAFSTNEIISLNASVAPLIKISRFENQLLVETNTPRLLFIREKNGEKQTQVIENYFLKAPFDPDSFYTIISSY